MRIAFDGKAVIDRGGAGRYAVNLIENLLKIDNCNEYKFLFNSVRGNISELPEVLNNKIKSIIGRYPNLFGSAHFLSPYKRNYPFLLRREKIDIFHGLFSMPVFSKSTKSIVTLHDITPVLSPDLFNKDLLRVRAKKIKLALNSDFIIAPSNYSKNTIINQFNISDRKIKVIYEGISDIFSPIPKDIAQRFIKDKYNIENKFILNVGLFLQYKNKENLVKAYHCLIKNTEIGHDLVLIGSKNNEFENIQKLVKELNIMDKAIFTGFVPDEDLSYFYSAADLFVFPSWAEGFGFPPLESMACGTPVVASNSTSIPEVTGDAAVLVNPANVDEIAEKMLLVIKNERLQEELREKGLKRAKCFSWRKTAEETLELYKQVCNS